MLDNDPQLAWIAVGVLVGLPVLSLMALAGWHLLTTRLSSSREDRIVRRRLNALKRVYWPLVEQGRLRRALGSEVMLRRRR